MPRSPPPSLDRLRTELSQIEKQIYDLETTYLEETKDFGNIFTGWDAYLAPDKVKQRKNVLLEDRQFSLSSVTSPASRKEDSKKVRRSLSFHLPPRTMF
jgi:chromatin modification-related protein EAF6